MNQKQKLERTLYNLKKGSGGMMQVAEEILCVGTVTTTTTGGGVEVGAPLSPQTLGNDETQPYDHNFLADYLLLSKKSAFLKQLDTKKSRVQRLYDESLQANEQYVTTHTLYQQQKKRLESKSMSGETAPESESGGCGCESQCQHANERVERSKERGKGVLGWFEIFQHNGINNETHTPGGGLEEMCGLSGLMEERRKLEELPDLSKPYAINFPMLAARKCHFVCKIIFFLKN